MTSIKKSGRNVENVFQLLGYHEDDISYSIAWVLSKSDRLLRLFLKDIIGSVEIDLDTVVISMQEPEKKHGRTDIEIADNDKFHIIIEAKSGWKLPGLNQLQMYTERKSFAHSPASKKVIVTLSECSKTYADHYQSTKLINGVPVMHISWKRVYEIANEAIHNTRSRERNLLSELMNYLGGLTNMQNQTSNYVFTVSLSGARIDGSSLTWKEIVTKKGKYFHPLGKYWPKKPVNYLAFRYDGKLQSIHHVESYTITKNFHDEIEELPDREESGPHIVYTLGQAIIPQKTVKLGGLYPRKPYWCFLDTLLTSDTLEQAKAITERRVNDERTQSEYDNTDDYANSK